jgi:PncC family amidohydrolase
MKEANESAGRVEDLSRLVLAEARVKGLTICCAESCTGGLLSGALTENAGSSDVFAGGVVSYSNRSKTRILKVPEELIQEYGAVSEECALAMASGVLDLFESDIACSVTGIAGPGGAAPGKPVGLVWFALTSSLGSKSFVRYFKGDRRSIREMAVASALMEVVEVLKRAKGVDHDC